MYNLFVKNFLFPLYLKRKKSPRLARLDFLEKSQWWPKEQLLAYQFNALQKIVKHAFETVPFYQKKYSDAGFHPDSLKSLKDMHSLPFTTKEDIQTHLQEMVSSDYPICSLEEDSSGGSTGKPTIFYKVPKTADIRRADQIRHDRWCGWDIGKKALYVWGAQRDINLYHDLKLRLLDTYLFRVKWVDAFDLTEEKLRAFPLIMEKYRPVMILAYANALYFVAKYLKKNGLSICPPAGIITSAETLTFEMRSLIEEVFSCKVLNRYGSREVGMIASECDRQEGLHVNSENIFVETVPFADSNVYNEIVVTDLHNFGMPLIRYKMGDMVKNLGKETCSCGRGLPLIGPIVGRSADFIVGKNGRYIHGEYFTHLFYGIQGVKEFHLLQERLDLIILSLVADSTFDRNYASKLREEISSQFDDGLTLDIKFVEKISKSPSGKFRFTESKVLI